MGAVPGSQARPPGAAPELGASPPLDASSPLDESTRGDDSRHSAAGQDWPWVEEWREGQEPTPWTTGLPLLLFAALVAGSGVYALTQGLADRPWLAVVVNVLAAGGLAPACWLSRALPVLRWLAGGVVLGVLVAWVAALVVIPVVAR